MYQQIKEQKVQCLQQWTTHVIVKAMLLHVIIQTGEQEGIPQFRRWFELTTCIYRADETITRLGMVEPVLLQKRKSFCSKNKKCLKIFVRYMYMSNSIKIRLFVWSPNMWVDTHTRALTHTYKRSNTHDHTRSHAHSQTHTPKRARTHRHARKHARTAR